MKGRKVRMGAKRTIQVVGLRHKQDEALELRLQGLSLKDVAKAMAAPVTSVARWLTEAMAAIPYENAEAVRKIETQKLDQREKFLRRVRDAAAEALERVAKAERANAKVHSASPEKPAAEAALAAAVAASLDSYRVALDADRNMGKIADRRARLLGLDAPVVTELTGPNGVPLGSNVTPAEAARLVREAFGTQNNAKVVDAEVQDEGEELPQLPSNVVDLRPATDPIPGDPGDVPETPPAR